MQNVLPFYELDNKVIIIEMRQRQKKRKPAPMCSLHPRGINELANCISIPLSIIGNTSLTTGKLPTDSNRANIIVSAIHKKGSKTLPQNYRLVSLKGAVSKIMEHIIRYTIIVHIK